MKTIEQRLEEYGVVSVVVINDTKEAVGLVKSTRG